MFVLKCLFFENIFTVTYRLLYLKIKNKWNILTFNKTVLAKKFKVFVELKDYL